MAVGFVFATMSRGPFAEAIRYLAFEVAAAVSLIAEGQLAAAEREWK